MHNYWWSALLFRIVLPCAIVSAGFIRPTVTSYIYTVLGCYMPFFSVPTSKTMAGTTGTYLKLLICVCILICLLVYSTYFILFLFTETQYQFEYCSDVEKLLRTFGIVNFNNLPTYELINWSFPEPLMLITCVILHFGFKKLTQEEIFKTDEDMERKKIIREANRKKVLKILFTFGKSFTCIMLCVTASLKSSAFGAVYYIMFLTLMTYWACNQTLGRVFARILICLIPIIFLNITIMIIYQFQYFHDSDLFDTKSIWGRLLHLVDLKTYKDCNDPRIFKFYDHSNATYVMPVCLFVLYQMVILISREILEAKDGILNLVFTCHINKENNAALRWREAIRKVRDTIEEQKSVSILSSHLMVDKIKNILHQILDMLMSVAYVFANIATMLWAIIYVSWSSLILIFCANLIWLLPYKRKVMLMASPFLVIYIIILLITAYTYSLELTRDQLPSKIGIFDASIIIANVDSGKEKWTTLMIKSLLAFVVFAAMKQYFLERSLNKRKERNSSVFGRTSIMLAVKAKLKDSFMSRFQLMIYKLLSFWWIWIVIITMIGIEFWSTITLFKIVFMGLVIIFLWTFQLLPFKAWKKFLRAYWWIAVTYALINFILLYMSQIKGTREFLEKYLSDDWYTAFHFEIFEDTKETFEILAWPLFLQIGILVQQNYFQKEFNHLTSPISPEDLVREEASLKKNSLWVRLVLHYQKIKNLVYAFLEAYLLNIILLIGWYMCLYDMCAIWVPVVFLLILACLFGNRFAKFIVHFIAFLVQIIIILRLIYMNQYRAHNEWNYTGYYSRNGKNYTVKLNSADWLGFHESNIDMYHADFWQLAWCFGYVFAVIIFRIVTVRMENYRYSKNLSKAKDIVIFSDITWKNCHDSTKNMLMYLANYGFYKFGCEITLIFAALVMGLRMDAMAIILSVWLLILFALNRKWMKRLWLPILYLHAVLVLWQYVNTLGWWPAFFYHPVALTEFWNLNDMNVRLQQFAHTSNLAHPPFKNKINLDFLLLLFMSRQWFVFRKESKLKNRESLAGSNENVSHLIEDPLVNNPVPDFMSNSETVIDSYKKLIFSSWFYFALVALFLAGTLRPTLFSFGNILGSFVFLWEGSNMFLKPADSILRRWNFLIAYNIILMSVRSINQIFECVLIYEDNIARNCKISRLFTIGCIGIYNMMEGIPDLSSKSTCKVTKIPFGLGWDCFSFFCLICQQRIFKSFHFFHIVNNAKAQTILSDRGAILIEEQRRKKRAAIDDEIIAIENNIKKKMERMKTNDKKIEEIRNGKYNQFDQVEKELNIPLVPEKEEEDSDYESFDPMPLPEYFGLYHNSDMKTVLEITALRKNRKKALRQLAESSKKNLDQKQVPSKMLRGASQQELLSKTNKITILLMFCWGGFESLVVSITELINRRTRKFRYILRQMHTDLEILQENTNFTQGVRLGAKKIWHPSESYKDVLTNLRKKSTGFQGGHFSIYAKLLKALWYLVMAYSEWLCYLVIILNQTLRSSFLSIPLVMMVFCWGALTVPNPTKTFWIISISYLLIMVFIKNIFNIGLSPWKSISYPENIYFPPDIIGLYNRVAILNLLMMVVFLFHRLVLQMLGLWKPSATRTTSLIESGIYSIQNNQFVPATTNLNSIQLLNVQHVEIDVSEYLPKSVIHGFGKYAEAFKVYVQQLISPSSTQIPVDVYTQMFICDLIIIIILLFFYGHFWDKRENVGIVRIVDENSVPVSFLIIILMYFLHMVIDRWIYIRRNRFAKLYYHMFQVMIVHLWFFIFFPICTERRFDETPVVQIAYVLKCFYFLFSAYQIRNGYPNIVSFNFLWHNYTTINRISYFIYRLIPYLLELRYILDWMASDTSLGLGSWFQIEDMTQRLFAAKCKQESEKNRTRPSGQPLRRKYKYLIGSVIYLALILTIIFPFLIFSLSVTLGKATQPLKIRMELYMGGASSAFVAFASEDKMRTLTKTEYKNLSSTFNNLEVSQDIFGSFSAEDILVVKWSSHSLTTWDISPGSRSLLLKELESEQDFKVRLEISYIHIGHGGKRSDRSFGQSTYIPPLPNVDRQNLINMVESDEATDIVVRLPLIFPKFLLINKESVPKALPLMEDFNFDNDKSKYSESDDDDDVDDDEDIRAEPTRMRNLLLTLNLKDDKWWQMREECSIQDDNFLYYLKDLVLNDCEEIVLYIFNEKVLLGTFLKFTQYGILGLYIIYFMIVVDIIRSLFTKVEDIWLHSLPNIDKILRKCMELYVARDMKNYALEKEIFEELTYIMRSREILIKLTRYEDNNYDPTFITPASSKT